MSGGDADENKEFIARVCDELAELRLQIRSLHERNSEKEIAKRWEGSATRVIALTFTTYVVVALYLRYCLEVSSPSAWLNAVVPAIG